MHIPELLAPAGGMRQLQTALRFGADAVYLGLEQYSLRAHAGNFSPQELREAVALIHAQGKKLYLTLNILPTDEQMEGLLRGARYAHELGVDAAIVADAGAVALLRAELPGLPLHLSTQANTLNTYAARFWHGQGVERIIVARELSLTQIAAMRAALPETLALEAFVHGAVCASYSGRCLLSAALTGRSANQGDCAQPCRWQYSVVERSGKHPALPVINEGQGTTVLSARDLCMIEHLPAMCAAGLASLKIEGRMKGEYYVAAVVGAYRRALDALADPAALIAPAAPIAFEAEAGGALLRTLRAEMDQVSHRAYDTGFFFGAPVHPGFAGGYTQGAEYVGYVLERLDDGWYRVEVKNRFFAGDALEAMIPGAVLPLRVKAIRLESTGELVDCVNQPLVVVHLPLPARVAAGDLLRGPCRNHSALNTAPN